MDKLETAIYLIKKMSKHTTSVTKQITFYNAKECSLICAKEVQAQYELEHDTTHFIFWEGVISNINTLKLENL